MGVLRPGATYSTSTPLPRSRSRLLSSSSSSSRLLSFYFPPPPPLSLLQPATLIARRAIPLAFALPLRVSSRRSCSVAAVADSEAPPPPVTSDPEQIKDIQLEGSSDGGEGGGGEGFGSGGGGGGGGDGSGRGEGDQEGPQEEGKKLAGGMSMSQKITLAYAALVGVGGIMGYIKSGSQKSLAAGGLSALVLYYVYTQLPVRPAFASSLGLGLSAALLAVMGSRFKRSGKIFPAGVVSFVSLIMVGGYFHGILRGLHA